MTARVRWGMIVGIVGMFVNTFASLVVALSGPILSFIFGIIAGLVVTRKEPASSKGKGAQQGAITGLIAGGLIFLGQVIGAVANLIYAQMPAYESLFGPVPELTTPQGQTSYWVIGIGVGLIFGLIDTLACVLGGSIIGRLLTKESNTPQT